MKITFQIKLYTHIGTICRYLIGNYANDSWNELCVVVLSENFKTMNMFDRYKKLRTFRKKA